MWVSKRLDLSWSDLAFGLRSCMEEPNRNATTIALESLWSNGGDAFVCQSVRTGFDLFLDALDLPDQCEIVFTALTISDMPRIARDRGLVPVPVDVSFDTMAPREDDLRAAFSDNTRAIVVTHLYGGQVAMEAILDFAHQRNVLVIEDCAEAFAGTEYTGDEESDVTMFSFGTIKFATALGGALLRVKDEDLLDRIREREAAYPVVPTNEYAAKLARYGALHTVSSPVAYGAAVGVLAMAGVNHDQVVHNLTKAFPGEEFYRRIRRRPSAAMLGLLLRRLRQNHDRFRERVLIGNRLRSRLRGHVRMPGAASLHHQYWLFPVFADDPPRLVRALRVAGFDATEGRSFHAVEIPETRRGSNEIARAVCDNSVFLPVYPEMPDAELEKMADLVIEALNV